MRLFQGNKARRVLERYTLTVKREKEILQILSMWMEELLVLLNPNNKLEI